MPTLNQIAIRRHDGPHEIDLGSPKFADPYALMLEYTEGHQDHLLEISGVNLAVRHQARQSLYQQGQSDTRQRKDYTPGEKSAEDAREIQRLNARITAFTQLQEALQKERDEALEERNKVRMELAAEKARKTIGTVELWTYASDGTLSNHYVLDAEDAGEEIAIGNVVVTLKRENP